MDRQTLINDGLAILRHEARDASKAARTWKHHNSLMRRAEAHIEAAGCCWEDYSSSLSREFAALLRL